MNILKKCINTIKPSFICIISALVLLTSCSTYESPDGDTYKCDEPYFYLNFNNQQKVSYMELNNKIIKVMSSIDIGGNFYIQECEGALYVSDVDAVLHLLGGEMIVSGTTIPDNEKDLLYLLPDTKKYPYFEEVYILEKVN